jgi:hypothetical protein
MADTDAGKLVTFNNASTVAVTLPRAGGSSLFVSGWLADVENQGAGAVTITPVTSTIDGAASVTLGQNAGVRIVSDGTNYFTQRGIGGGSVAVSGGANLILATPNGYSGPAGLRALVGADLPLPSPSSPGGVQSKDCTGIGLVQKIGTDGTVTCGAAGSGGGAPGGPAGGALTGGYPNPGLSSNLSLRQIEATFDGSGSNLVGGATFCKAIGYAGTIQSVVLTASPAGSGTVDILTDPSYAHFALNGAPGAASITAADVPTISSTYLMEDTALAGWTTSFTAKTVFCFKLSNPATATTITATLMVSASN